MVPGGGVIGAESSGVHCEPRGLVKSRTPVSPTNGRMSISTKFCIGTEPGFCTRRRYFRAPPVRVPAEVETEPPSQVPWIVLLETSWAIGATFAVPVGAAEGLGGVGVAVESRESRPGKSRSSAARDRARRCRA